MTVRVAAASARGGTIRRMVSRAILTTALFLTMTGIALACRVATAQPPGIAHAFKSADSVFAGRVRQIAMSRDDPAQGLVLFSVTQTYKGTAADRHWYRFRYVTDNCHDWHQLFQIGKDALVFVVHRDGEAWATQPPHLGGDHEKLIEAMRLLGHTPKK